MNIDQLTHFGRKIQLFVAKGPAYHYTYGRWRLNRWLGRRQAETVTLDNRTFFAQLNLKQAGLSQVKQAVDERNYEQAKINLKTYFQTRNTPRFFFEPSDIKPNIALIDPHQQQTTIRSADEICRHTFHFRRAEPVKFEDNIDWAYRPHGNLDWTWDLNRHAYFETLGRAYWYTGDERYAQKFGELLLDWLAKNPVSINQPNWASVFEVAFRINAWLWAFYYFRSAAAFDPAACQALLQGLLAHGRYLDAYLELHAQNNHLLLEAKALAMLGVLFPEFKLAVRWRERGLRVLYQQIGAQVYPDGVHGEQATHYHRVISGELLELLVLLENNCISVPMEIKETFGRMVEFELWITKPNGQIPLLGDSALEDTYLRFSAATGGPAFLGRPELKSIAPPLDEASVWLLGHQRAKPYLDQPTPPGGLNSRAFPEGGYFVMRHGQNTGSAYLVFDCGPFGYKPVPSHGHADALSFELYAHGQTLVVDSGIYSTQLGRDWRNFFRGSRAHNTVVVDDQDQSTLVDIWRVYHPAQATLHQWLSSDYFDFVDGSHDGYERLAEPITHRRQIFFAKPEYWVVIDSLMGQSKHCFDFYFHLPPDLATRLEPNSGLLCAGNGDGAGLIIAPLTSNKLEASLITGATEPIQGWVSFFSGEKQPAPTLRYRQQAIAPFQFCAVLYPYPAGTNVSVAVSPLDVALGGQSRSSQLTGLRIETDTHIDYLVVEQEPARQHKVFAAYETDAQLVYIRHKKENNELARVIIRGGDQLLVRGQSVLKAARLAQDFILDGEIAE